jgi:methylthioribulose-1-phosphate dehydratase
MGLDGRAQTAARAKPRAAKGSRGGHLEAIRQLRRLAAELHARAWCLGTSGNLSAVVDRAPLRLVVTASGRFKNRLGSRDFVVVDEAGRLVGSAPAGVRPSAEARLHATIAAATGAGSVLHTHSVASTLLGEHFRARGGFQLGGYEMLKGLEGIHSHEAEVFVPVLENSQDMAALAAEARRVIELHPGLHGFLIAGHGLYTWGDTLAQAERHLEIFEFLLECAARRTRFAPLPG